jgi:hypothetical protein
MISMMKKPNTAKAVSIFSNTIIPTEEITPVTARAHFVSGTA